MNRQDIYESGLLKYERGPPPIVSSEDSSGVFCLLRRQPPSTLSSFHYLSTQIWSRSLQLLSSNQGQTSLPLVTVSGSTEATLGRAISASAGFTLGKQKGKLKLWKDRFVGTPWRASVRQRRIPLWLPLPAPHQQCYRVSGLCNEHLVMLRIGSPGCGHPPDS